MKSPYLCDNCHRGFWKKTRIDLASDKGGVFSIVPMQHVLLMQCLFCPNEYLLDGTGEGQPVMHRRRTEGFDRALKLAADIYYATDEPCKQPRFNRCQDDETLDRYMDELDRQGGNS